MTDPFRPRVSVSWLTLLLCLSLPAFAAPAAHPSRPHLAPCKIPGADRPVAALCGVYPVWENREAKAGRKIGLQVVVLPARSAHPLRDPVFYLAGGPGTSTTAAAGYYATSALRQERDLVFINQRGTGEPDKLVCQLAGADLQSHLGEDFPLDAVRRCRDELGKKYDLTRYTIAAAVDDLAEVLHGLGYRKVNLVARSYGTRGAQLYLRRHPEMVRTVTLWGAVPMDEAFPLAHAATAQRSLDLVLGACEADAACHGKFPAVRKDFQAVMDRLSQGPVEVEVSHPETHQPVRVRLPREAAAEGIRLLLYSGDGEAALPLLIHQAAAGDWKALTENVIAARAGLDRFFAMGLFFSVTCSQDLPFLDPAEIPARTAGSFLGDDRVRRQSAACALWPHGRVAPEDRLPVHAEVPVLIINGERDPVAPPDYGRRIAQFLPRSLALVERHSSHEDESGCTEKIADTFLRRGTTQGLDTSCLGQIPPKPFFLEWPKEGIQPFG